MLLRYVLFTASLALALAGCDPAATPDTDPHLQPVSPVAAGGNAFQVRVTVSEAAAAALAGNAESIIVAADYFGYPSVSAQQRQLPGTQEPRLPLARQRTAMDAAGTVGFPEIALDSERLQLVEQGRPHVRVEVHSSGADAAGPADADLLDCGTFQGTLAVAVRDGVDIHCKLAAE